MNGSLDKKNITNFGGIFAYLAFVCFYVGNRCQSPFKTFPHRSFNKEYKLTFFRKSLYTRYGLHVSRFDNVLAMFVPGIVSQGIDSRVNIPINFAHNPPYAFYDLNAYFI